MEYLRSVILIILYAGLFWAGGKKLFKAIGFSFSGKAEEFVFSFAVGFGITGYAVLFLGMAHLLNGMYAAGLGMIAIILFSRELRECVIDVYGALSLIRPNVYLCMAFAAGIVVLVGSMAPSFSNDSMVYHLVDAKYFAQNQMVAVIPFNSANALWPYLVEMHYTLAIMAGLMPLAGLMHFSLAAASAIGVYALAKRFVSSKVAALASAVFFLTPGILMEANQTYVDLGAVLYALTAVYAFIVWLEGRDIKWAALAGVMCGLGLSVKYFAVVVPVILGAWMIVRCSLFVVRCSKNDRREMINEHVTALLAFCGATVVFSYVWYIRQWIVMGNPFFPFFTGLFGTSGLTPEVLGAISETSIKGSMGLGTGLKDLITLPWRVTMRPDMFGGEQLGPLFLAVIPCIILVKNVARPIKQMLVFAAAYIVLWFFGYQNIRFLLPVVPFLSVIAAYALYEAAEPWSLLGRTLRGAVLVLMVFYAALAVYFNIGAVKPVLGMETSQSYLAKNERSYEVSEYLNMNLPRKSKVLVVNEIHTFYIDIPYRRELYYWIFAKYDSKLDTPEKVMDFFRKEGFTHVLYASDGTTEKGTPSPNRLTELMRSSEFNEMYFKHLYTNKPRAKNANGTTYDVWEIK
jgi:hypothetical protein